MMHVGGGSIIRERKKDGKRERLVYPRQGDRSGVGRV